MMCFGETKKSNFKMKKEKIMEKWETENRKREKKKNDRQLE